MREFSIKIWQERDGEVFAGWLDYVHLPGRWEYQVAWRDDVLLHVNVISRGVPQRLIDAVIKDHLYGIELGSGKQIA